MDPQRFPLCLQEIRNQMEQLKPAFETNNIPVVFSIGDEYVPVFAVALKSIIACSSEENHYDILILDTDISEAHKRDLGGLLGNHDNFSLRYVSVLPYLASWDIRTYSYIPVRTYYRLLIPQLFTSYDKVLYLDADLVVCQDIATLFATDIGEAYIAAVSDPDFLGQLRLIHMDTFSYATKDLGLENPFAYVQAGVMLFNVTALNRHEIGPEFLKASECGYRYADQDVLNQVCQHHVHVLSPIWNVLTDYKHLRVRHIISHAPKEVYAAYLDARKHPAIIHYAGSVKPWTVRKAYDFGNRFWEYAKDSPWFEVLRKQQKGTIKSRYRETVADLANFLLPYGSIRREKIKHIFKKLKKRAY